MEDRVEHRAVRFAESYFRKQGWDVQNVSHARGAHGGYDLFLQREAEQLRVEVKGCTRLYQIPDPYVTEFDPDSRKLIADVLCVVYFLDTADAPQLALIPRDAIPTESVIPKFGYRISGRFKNAQNIGRFLVTDAPAQEAKIVPGES